VDEAAPVRSRWIRRHLLPAILIGGVAVVRLLIYGMEKTEIGLDHHFNAVLGFQFLAMAAVLLLGIWFFFLSGYPRFVKLTGFGLGVTSAVLAFATVQKVEFDGHMNPSLRWRWEETAEEQLAKHRQQVGEAVGGADLTLRDSDSPSFRGPAGDGAFPGLRLANWDSNPPTVLWKHPVGNGHAGIAVAGNSVVTIEQDGNDEVVYCYDRDTGKPRWFHSYTAKFSHSEPMGGAGPRTTPAVADGDVYSLGAQGDLVCLEGKSGTRKWHVNILTDNGATNLEWGLSGSPVLSGNKVIVNPGINPSNNAKQAVAAYDRTTGKKIWAAGSSPAAYASPQVVTLSGKLQVLVFDANGLGGYDLNAGTELWRFPWKTSMNMNSAQPVVTGPGTVFVSSELSNGGGVVRITFANGEWKAEQVWKNRAIFARFATPIYYEGHLYGLAGSRLLCLDAANGSTKWSEGDFGDGQILRSGNKLFISNGKGKLKLVVADPTEYLELGTVEVFKDRTWNVPALAGNQLFIRNHREMACLTLAEVR